LAVPAILTRFAQITKVILGLYPALYFAAAAVIAATSSLDMLATFTTGLTHLQTAAYWPSETPSRKKTIFAGGAFVFASNSLKCAITMLWRSAIISLRRVSRLQDPGQMGRDYSHAALLETDARAERDIVASLGADSDGDGRVQALAGADGGRVSNVGTNHHGSLVKLTS
jgi:hypothetical protein